jgi:hypothetical protein
MAKALPGAYRAPTSVNQRNQFAITRRSLTPVGRDHLSGWMQEGRSFDEDFGCTVSRQGMIWPDSVGCTEMVQFRYADCITTKKTLLLAS